MLRYVPSIPTLIRVLIMYGCCTLSNAFYASMEMIMGFWAFLLLLWCMTLIDLCMLNHPCEPGISPTWSWCMIFLICCWIRLAKILLRILCLYSSKILAYNFLFQQYLLSGFGVRVMVTSENTFGSVLSSSNFWKSLRRMGINSSLFVWQNLPVKPSGSGLLYVGNAFMTYSISFLVISLFS